MIRAYLGTQPQLAAGVYVDPQAAVIGAVRLGEDASVWPFASVRGDVHRIEIGARTNVQDNAVLHVTHDGPYSPGGVPLLIGEDVTIGHGVILHACTVGDRCLIGMGSIVLDRAVIEDEVLLAAGSTVPPGKRLESGWLYRGAPATQARRLSESEIAHFRYSAAHYVKIKNHYLQGEAG
ncbi:Carbonic anhydrase or acetyltransferase, isoleucine patch superfamily [Solimonas aquatica]|uniref:Carbonic anhydrase or acetyltransferase, isoleucine patch superfamily n=1 Tax=Solimonas aquatica TaxID=489703 RepID=A0A1H9BLM3_9GAMM|nr:gamma carbonic anhydrase family protein [Solimonas aquatica]SEP89856.1 Carbonic anhydrase or acetyltransferase, isoleucine patch superfamily [Solimonas aquatica]